MEMDRSRRNSLNKKKGKDYERAVVKLFQKYFPKEKFARVPDSRAFKYTNTLGDIIIPQDFPHRQIECRNRQHSQSYDMKRFFEDFETGTFGKWLEECINKFNGEKWLIVFKIGRGDSYCVSVEDLGIEHYLYNGKCWVYRFTDYLDKIQKDRKKGLW